MLTDRDKEIIKYIEDNKEVDFMDLYNNFFNGRTMQIARHRLKLLVDRGHIKRKKGIDDRYYIYYI